MSEKTVTIQAQAGIPMPDPKQRKPRAKTVGKRIVWPIETMQVTESFLIPEWAETTRWKAAVTRAKRDGRIPPGHQFKMMKTEEGMRVWRIQ